MRPHQTLNEIVARAVPALDSVIDSEKADVVLVQGDTSTAFCAALAAFNRRALVVHLEAGLRSRNRGHPYPEEANRRMIACLTNLHLAPTPLAGKNLLDEGAEPGSVVVTGNTVVDALILALNSIEFERVESLVFAGSRRHFAPP